MLEMLKADQIDREIYKLVSRTSDSKSSLFKKKEGVFVFASWYYVMHDA